ncbi:MAG: helix-turn-helix transcriptional regulator [Lachnospiraceae bacterium]|nr:helix-turn-helix transcriptional regulator [Lachnospiraceae bacterium]
MTDTTIKTLTTTLRQLRSDAGYTQDKVSHLLKIQRATYCNYENGSRTPPLDILIALAELYQVSMDYLVRGIDTVTCTGPFSKELFKEADPLPADFQQEVLDYILFKKLRRNKMLW